MEIWNTLVCVWSCIICRAVSDNGELVLTSSQLTVTDGEPFTLICSVSSGYVVTMVWLQNNTTKVITQVANTCNKYPPLMGIDNTNRFNVTCSDTVHSLKFTFNSTTDQGGWQCGVYVNDTYTYPRSNIFRVEVARPVMSTQSSSTISQHTETTSEPGIMTSQKGVAGPVMTTTTRYMGTSPERGAVTSQKASTDDRDSYTIYIVVGAVGGVVLLAVVVVSVVCIRRRGQATHHQNDMKEDRHVEVSPVYQNTASFHTDSSAPVTKPEKTHQGDPVMSEDVNSQNMYESLTSVEMHIYRRLK